jgi:hypothetical protein
VPLKIVLVSGHPFSFSRSVLRQLAGRLFGGVLIILWSLPALAPALAVVSQTAGHHEVFASLRHGHVDLVFTHREPTSPPAPTDHPLPTRHDHDEDHVVQLPHPDEQRLNRDPDLPRPGLALTDARDRIQGLARPRTLTSLVAVPPPPEIAAVWLDYLHAALPPRAPSRLT